MRPLWPELVKMGARLDVVAPIRGINWSTKLPNEMQFDRTSVFFTFAHFAALFRDYDLLKTAIAQRADLNMRSYLFGSALHVACDNGDRNIAELLLRNGAHADSVLTFCVWQRHTFSRLFLCVLRASACQTHTSVNANGQSIHKELIGWFCRKDGYPSESTTPLMPRIS